ncbi:membrane protein [Gordonia phage Catfish]|uniref:Membrane protein n=1 Tax=Gordonia phage Catfish TaxID=2301538 RepID=A0A385D1D8_9CAUD|nr:membrane protein [Gordonia phage Catfish]AXQ51869.1 membrane protein [Gordonia phage Catfish]
MRGRTAMIASAVIMAVAVVLMVSSGRYAEAGALAALWVVLFVVWRVRGRQAQR